MFMTWMDYKVTICVNKQIRNLTWDNKVLGIALTRCSTDCYLLVNHTGRDGKLPQSTDWIFLIFVSLRSNTGPA